MAKKYAVYGNNKGEFKAILLNSGLNSFGMFLAVGVSYAFLRYYFYFLHIILRFIISMVFAFIVISILDKLMGKKVDKSFSELQTIEAGSEDEAIRLTREDPAFANEGNPRSFQPKTISSLIEPPSLFASNDKWEKFLEDLKTLPQDDEAVKSAIHIAEDHLKLHREKS